MAAGILLLPAAGAQEWRPLFNGKNLDGWEVHGDGIWTVMPGGTLVGQRKLQWPKDFPFPLTREFYQRWFWTQSWLYTVEEFDQFDLRLDWWLPAHGNSGVSIRDSSRGKYAARETEESGPTPAHIGYEIQIATGVEAGTPTGSIYSLVKAKGGQQREFDWNRLDIESRRDAIRVRLNGRLVAEHPGLPERPKTGPIGLQLHDQHSVVMFRDIQIRVIE